MARGGDGGVGCGGTAAGEEGEEKKERGGEWGSGLGRSEEEEHIWCSPEKSAGKVFRRRRSGGGRNPAAEGRPENMRERERESIALCVVVSILEGFTDEPPLEKKNDWKKILYDDPIDDLIFDPVGDVDAFLDIDIPTNIKDGFYDSGGDVLYLESLLSNDTILSLPPEVFLDHDPRSLSDINDYGQSFRPRDS
ncbi:hypothetical protein Tco_0811900 [Tanacetum coccineum]